MNSTRITLAFSAALACLSAVSRRASADPPPPSSAPAAHPRCPVGESTAVTRDWLSRAVVYGVVPRAFDSSHGARAVTERLASLRDLGVGAIYLSPVHATPVDDFGYAVTNYGALRSDFGTDDEMRALVRTAHGLGLCVFMDIVPNHTSSQHPWFLDAEARGPASPYYRYYDRDRRGVTTHYFDWSNLPNLAYGDPVVDRAMVEALAHQVRAYDIDGFRVDAAWGIERRAPAFWPRAVRELRAQKPGLVMIAEASAHDRYFARAGFDAEYDWTERLGDWSWAHMFDQPTGIPERLRAALDGPVNTAISQRGVFRFLNNNDTGARFVTRHGVDLTRVASALLLTLPGTPLVYTGDEVGAAFEPYGPPPWEISWDDRVGLRAHYQRLIALRERIPALGSRCMSTAPTDRSGASYAFVRYGCDGSNPVLVVLNFGAAETTHVRIPARIDLSETVQDHWTGASLSLSRSAGGRVAIAMPAYGIRVMPLRRSAVQGVVRDTRGNDSHARIAQ